MRTGDVEVEGIVSVLSLVKSICWGIEGVPREETLPLVVEVVVDGVDGLSCFFDNGLA